MELLERLTRRQVDTLRALKDDKAARTGVHLSRVAEILAISAPSALAHLTALESLGLVDRYRGRSRLTPKGQSCLLEYERHHRIVERMFDRMGLPRERLCEAAREVDLSIGHATIERLCVADGHPGTCPHGEPIPRCPHRGKEES